MDNTGPTDQSLRQFPYKIILSIEDFLFFLDSNWLLTGYFIMIANNLKQIIREF